MFHFLPHNINNNKVNIHHTSQQQQQQLASHASMPESVTVTVTVLHAAVLLERGQRLVVFISLNTL